MFVLLTWLFKKIGVFMWVAEEATPLHVMHNNIIDTFNILSRPIRNKALQATIPVEQMILKYIYIIPISISIRYNSHKNNLTSILQ